MTWWQDGIITLITGGILICLSYLVGNKMERQIDDQKPQVCWYQTWGCVVYNTWIQLNCNIVLNRPQTILYIK